VFREVPLLKVSVIMMVLALALLIAAVVVSVTLGSHPERMVAAEVAAKSPGEAPRYSSGEEVSATNKSSSQKESLRYPSGEEESLGYGSSSSGESVGQGKEEAKEPQTVLQQEAKRLISQSPMPQPAGQQTPSEVPSEPEPQPQEQPLQSSEGRGWQKPTQGELKSANRARHYELLPGAIMGLTIEAIGIYDAPSSTQIAAGR
jgi:hypothetical protein